MIDDTKNEILKQKVTERAQDKSFRHNQWFVEYHLEIVEKISQELCLIYYEANPQFINALVWLHDYEKIIDFDKQYNTELSATRNLLEEIGYSAEAIDKLASSIIRYNAKENLAEASIEIQIVSSADAASHLVGPFYTLYWYENPNMSLQELQASGLKKQEIDWGTKITLPEVKKAFEVRNQLMKELAGTLPTSYLS